MNKLFTLIDLMLLIALTSLIVHFTVIDEYFYSFLHTILFCVVWFRVRKNIYIDVTVVKDTTENEQNKRRIRWYQHFLKEHGFNDLAFDGVDKLAISKEEPNETSDV